MNLLSNEEMLAIAREKKYDRETLIEISRQCIRNYKKVDTEDWLKLWTDRKRIITLFVKLYGESGNALFYQSVCKISFVTERDARLIFNARLNFLEKEIRWWHRWPLLLKRK